MYIFKDIFVYMKNCPLERLCQLILPLAVYKTVSFSTPLSRLDTIT